MKKFQDLLESSEVTKKPSFKEWKASVKEMIRAKGDGSPDKSFKQHLKEEGEAATNATGDAIASKDNPLFKTSRFANKTEFTIPHDHYETIKHGREAGTKWDPKLPNKQIQDAVRNELYKNGQCLITSDVTNASILLQHMRRQRQKQFSEQTEELDVEAIAYDKLTEEVELTFGDDADDEFYDPAYDYAQDHGYSEDEADLFANIVLCFFQAVFDDEDQDDNSEVTQSVKSLLANAVQACDAGSRAKGLNTSTAELVKDVMKYIDLGFDLNESTDLPKFLKALNESHNMDIDDVIMAFRKAQITFRNGSLYDLETKRKIQNRFEILIDYLKDFDQNSLNRTLNQGLAVPADGDVWNEMMNEIFAVLKVRDRSDFDRIITKAIRLSK